MLQFKLMMSGIWQHLQPVLMLFLTTIGKQVLLSALGAVSQAAAQTQMSSSEKRDYAAELIKKEVDGAGAKAINLAIEIAVNKLDPKPS